MRELSGFLGFLVLILALRWVMPPEAADLAGEILVSILTIIRNLLMQART